MRIAAGLIGALIALIVVWDAFEVMVLPRRVARRVRIVRVFFRAVWKPWRGVAARIKTIKRREGLLSIFGPLSIIALIILWAVSLVFCFALVQWGLATELDLPDGVNDATFGTYRYLSGTTFATLGFGDITPRDPFGQFIAIVEAGTGFGFLALVIGYLPVLYGAFSRREINIALLDARAGSPPTAVELLRRHAQGERLDALENLFAEWERWSAELLESHLSYPVLSYYRSQHNNQSWLAALVCILDACALTLTTVGDSITRLRWQAQLTFAMARHALVDVAQAFDGAPQFARLRQHGDTAAEDRLTADAFDILLRTLEDGGFNITRDDAAREHLTKLRSSYEPYAVAFADYLLLPLPAWNPDAKLADNWQTSKWTPALSRLAVLDSARANDHDRKTNLIESEKFADEEHAW